MKSQLQLAVGATVLGCMGEIGRADDAVLEPLTRGPALDSIFGNAHSSTANAIAWVEFA